MDNSTAKRWYSLDGTFLRLVMEPGALWPDNDWTLFKRDGGRVEFRNLAGGEQRTTRFDRNGNQLVWSRGT